MGVSHLMSWPPEELTNNLAIKLDPPRASLSMLFADPREAIFGGGELYTGRPFHQIAPQPPKRVP